VFTDDHEVEFEAVELVDMISSLGFAIQIQKSLDEEATVEMERAFRDLART
jgi:hypothetical protein